MDRLRQLFSAVSAQALGMAYYVRLGRELGVVDSVLGTLSYDDCCQVTAQLMRSLERDEITAERDEAFNRLRSDNNTLRRTGLAQWLSTAYLETRDVESGDIQQRHIEIKRVIRALQKRSEPPVAKNRERVAV
jgi:hypothetical protein